MKQLTLKPYKDEEEGPAYRYYISSRIYSTPGKNAAEIKAVAEFLTGNYIHMDYCYTVKDYLKECIEIINKNFKGKYHLMMKYNKNGIDGNNQRCLKFAISASSGKEEKNVCDIFLYQIKKKILFRDLKEKKELALDFKE